MLKIMDSSYPVSKSALWTGRILSGFITLFILFDSIIHLLKIQPVIDSFNQLGLPLTMAVPLGIIALACIILYNIPQTSILGAVLLTGYLGGAVCTNFRAGTPLFSNILFSIYVGIIAWLGLYLREPKLKALMPFKN